MHKTYAETALSIIESEQGKLNPRFKKQARDYSHEVLGRERFSPWLNVYTAVAGEFKEGWLPDDYYGRYVVPKISGLYGKTSATKPLNQKLLGTDNLPDIAYFINGLFFSSTWEVIKTKDIAGYLFADCGQIVYKKDSSNQGAGVILFEKNNFTIDKIYQGGNGVFQKFINQHDFFTEFVPGPVATLRITSVVGNSGEITCRAAFLRLGRKSETHIKWTNNLIIPIDLDSGILDERAYLPNWSSVKEKHPDTNISFAGKQIPKFEECLEFIIKTHQAIPFCRCVGWDIILDKDEKVQLIEWNGEHNDIKFSEATQGPCFADMGWERIHREDS